MAYNATYASTDIGPSVIDLIVGIIAILVSFAALIGLVILYRWVKGRSSF